jgi:acyl-CoA synthetase (AMP-forming)/AMP-acid ligase II
MLFPLVFTFKICFLPTAVLVRSYVQVLDGRNFMVFEECCNDLVNTKLAFTSDGWFRTGDMRNLDGNGRLSLTGRQKDIVIING